MKFKTFVAQDLEACTKAFIEVFNCAPWNDEWTTENATRYLRDFSRTPGFLGLLAIEQDEIVGFIFGVRRMWWSGEEFFIHEMCVKSQKQHTGIGTALLNQLVNELAPHAIQNITLLTDRGIPAEAFYKKNGFEEIERIIFLSKDL
ncbi:GNAT family N-acetyltransferase [Solibacillus daqui]|uniref:GNAT family N-acetyltransferase n=1 Tax=Solibacillus daqui TaxID=2912187 RepID=UPI0023664B58|nr:GNAT family N-acetyltransferase [Solibacillus daqui]